MEFATMYSNLLRDDDKASSLFTQLAEKEVMANVSKLIWAAAITVASITTPAFAAHKGKTISAHHHHIGYVTRSSRGSGIYDFAPISPGYGAGSNYGGVSSGGEPGGF